MMMLGRLLSDVAHEVSNPLTTLVARSAMIRMSSTLEDAHRHAGIIEQQGQRAARSMRALSIFGQRHEPGRVLIDLNEVVRAALELELAIAHASDIAAHSVEGVGTIVTLTLPRPVAASPAVSESAAPEGAPAARLLVVDDERDVGELLSDILRTRGYETQYVASPKAALELTRDRGFQGVLMDLRMPEMSGTELWRELQRERPALALKTIFMTGDYASPDTAAMVRATQRPVLSKPF